MVNGSKGEGIVWKLLSLKNMTHYLYISIHLMHLCSNQVIHTIAYVCELSESIDVVRGHNSRHLLKLFEY